MSLNQTLEGVAHTVSHPAGLVHKLLRDAHGSGGHIAHGIDDRVHVCTSYLPQLYISVYISILMNLFGIYHIYPLRGGQVVLCVGLVGVLVSRASPAPQFSSESDTDPYNANCGGLFA